MAFGKWGRLAAGLLAAWVAGSGEARAQVRSPRAVAVEATGGWAGFVDDATIEQAVFGASARVPLTRRLSIGPEIVHMIGEHTDRNTFVLGSLWIDVGPTPETARLVPYVVVGLGYMHHSHRVPSGRFTSGEGSFTAGGGARVHVTPRVYVGGDARIGWELHLRTTAHVGLTWPRR
jgi:hypothetical protein